MLHCPLLVTFTCIQENLGQGPFWQNEAFPRKPFHGSCERRAHLGTLGTQNLVFLLNLSNASTINTSKVGTLFISLHLHSQQLSQIVCTPTETLTFSLELWHSHSEQQIGTHVHKRHKHNNEDYDHITSLAMHKPRRRNKDNSRERREYISKVKFCPCDLTVNADYKHTTHWSNNLFHKWQKIIALGHVRLFLPWNPSRK